jgi:hypothetical protein
MATAWPMPRVPPVTSALWPAKENMFNTPGAIGLLEKRRKKKKKKPVNWLWGQTSNHATLEVGQDLALE